MLAGGGADVTILIQGALSASNVAEVARHAQHWRTLFDKAQLVFSISETDLLDIEGHRPGLVEELRPVTEMAAVGPVVVALRELRAVCDTIVLAGPALPMPPLKFDEKVNNGNLQIAAAQSGLKSATGMYTLRIRSDMTFHDGRFVAFYHQHRDFGARRPKAFRQRIMVCPIFTLNPFGAERLPFHVSDLFHFGLTEDLRRLWDVPPISYADATYYEVHPHAPHSNDMERQFRARFAVEQHIHWNALSKVHPELVLEYHNDPSGADAYVRCLADEFVVCDVEDCRLQLRKWHALVSQETISALVVSYEQWRLVASRGYDEPARVLAQELEDNTHVAVESEAAPAAKSDAMVVDRVADLRTRSAAALVLRFSAPHGGSAVARLCGSLLLYLARQSSRNGSRELAGAFYRWLLRLDANRPRAWIQYGHILKSRGDRAAAAGAYWIATTLLPDDADALLHYQAARAELDAEVEEGRR